MTARRIALDAKDLETRLPDYPGSYYGEAFGTAYSFRPEKGRLIMHHRRYGDMRTQPIDVEEFLCILGFVKFNRNPKGEVVGFTLTSSDEKLNFQGVEFISEPKHKPAQGAEALEVEAGQANILKIRERRDRYIREEDQFMPALEGQVDIRIPEFHGLDCSRIV
jgi:hypothetical protein